MEYKDMNILAIDPGTQNGIAEFYNGNLVRLETQSVIDIIDSFEDLILSNPIVIIEDSRMQSFMFTGKNQNRSVALSMARKVGQVDMVCNLIHEKCNQHNINLICISPRQKGKKLNAIEFEKVTGWTGKSNQHERDAAMVGWNYRNAAKVA